MIVEGSFIQTHKYGGIAVDVYNGAYKIVAARKAESGKIYADWCYPQKYEDGEKSARSRAVPWGINLGDEKEKAINVLRAVARAVKGAEPEEPLGAPGDDLGDDIPF